MIKKGRTSAFVMGLIAGIVNLLIGVFLLLAGLLSTPEFGSVLTTVETSTDVFLFVGVFFTVTLVNLIGGSICKSNPILGGIFMLITALPMLVLSILFIYALSYIGVNFFYVFFLLIQLLSLTGAIISFVPKKVQMYSAPYGQYGQQPYGQYEQPYGQYGQQPYGQAQQQQAYAQQQQQAHAQQQAYQQAQAQQQAHAQQQAQAQQQQEHQQAAQQPVQPPEPPNEDTTQTEE